MDRLVIPAKGLAWLVVLTLGAVGIVCALAVRLRDVMSALPFLLQLGVFFAPIGYSLAGLSPFMRKVVELNPITGLIESLRWMMFSGDQPHRPAVVISLVLTVVLAVMGWRVFARRETTMADVI